MDLSLFTVCIPNYQKVSRIAENLRYLKKLVSTSESVWSAGHAVRQNVADENSHCVPTHQADAGIGRRLLEKDEAGLTGKRVEVWGITPEKSTG